MRSLTGWKVLTLLLVCVLATGVEAQGKKDIDDATDESSAQSSNSNDSENNHPTEEVVAYGTREEGYVSNTSSLGPLGDVSLLETPVSVYVMSRHLIENLQVVSPDMLFKVNPIIQFTNPQARFFSYASVRGFNLQTTFRTDGIALYSPWVSPDIEDKEQVEVISGLSGFFNGVGNVGGTINYVRKRPTSDPLANVTVGLNGGTNAYVHGDFGGMFGQSDKFGYRVNALVQDGDAVYSEQSIKKTFGSVAFDWNITNNLLLQVDGSYSDYKMTGSDPYWDTSFPGGISSVPPAPDPDRFYGQPWTFTKTKQDHYGARIAWTLSDNVYVRVGLLHQDAELELVAANNGFVAGGNVGDYMVYAPTFKYPETDALGGYAYLHVDLETGSVKHQITAGYYGNTADQTNFSGTFQGYPDLANPDVYNYNDPTPVLPVPDPFQFTVYRQGSSRNDNFVIADQAAFGEHWSVLAGLNKANINQRTFDTDGKTVVDKYDDGHVTPSYAILYRINPEFTVYTSYMEGLERGGTAGATFGGAPVVNAGQTLSPLISDQVELGFKAQVGKTLFTAALFDINKGLEYYDQTDPAAPVYRQNGRQVHRGVELTLTGEVLDNLIVVAGLTALEPKIEDNSDPNLVGNRPDHVAKRFGTLYLEYQPQALPAVTFTGGVFYTGSMYADIANTLTLPSFTTLDLGARYETKIFGGKPITFRLNVTNVADENYWLTGQSLGQKRTVYLSATMNLL